MIRIGVERSHQPHCEDKVGGGVPTGPHPEAVIAICKKDMSHDHGRRDGRKEGRISAMCM